MEVAALGLRVDGASNIDQAAGSLDHLTNSATKAERASSSLGSSSSKVRRNVDDLGSGATRANGVIATMATRMTTAGSAIATAGRNAMASANGVDRMNKSIRDTSQESEKTTSSLKRLFAAATAGLTAMAVIDTGDSWGQYASRIKNATSSLEEYQYVQARMTASANDTYRSITETREAFLNLSPVIRSMGFSLEESINAVDTFSGLLVVNGANAERGAAAMSALSRSLQKGKVDADAWSTIYSTADTVVESLARSMGKTEAEIRRLGAAGKLTGQQIAQALSGDYVRVMDQVAKMPTTVRDAMQNVGNSFSEMVGQVNSASGATSGLASLIDRVADKIGSEDFIAGAIEGFMAWSGTVEAIAGDFVQLDKILADFSGNAQEDASSISFSFAEMPANIRAMIQIATIEIASFIDAQMNGIQALAAAVKALPDGPSAAVEAFNAVRAQRAELGRIRLESIDAVLQERDAILQAGRDAANSYRNTRRAALEFNATVVEGNAPLAALTNEQKKAAKAMQDFAAKSALSVSSTNALAAAYLISAEAVTKATRQQQIDAEVLKLGEKNRAAITKQINAQADALEALDLSKNIADMRKQNSGLADYAKALLAGGTATKAGRDALVQYNDAREIEAAQIGKTSEEIAKLIPQLREEQRIRREGNQIISDIERMNELVSETRTVTERANAELAELRELAGKTDNPKYLEAISRKIIEIQNETNLWGKATQAAIDRVDEVGADFWKSFLDGGKFSFSSLKDIAKQWAAEMLNMLTFKPLLTSFSNMLFSTNNSGGIGDIWGSLFGGSSGGSGGGFGSLISIGKNIYSAYNAITGVGADMLAGWQSGGINGAFQAGGNYYGGMIKNVTSAIGSYFAGSAYSNLTSAAVSQGLTQGAAQFGSQFAMNAGQQVSWAAAQGAATGAAQGAASGAGSGALSGVVSSVAGMLTNPVTWITAGVMASWKLHEAGIKPDTEMYRDSWGKGDTSTLGGQIKETGSAIISMVELMDKTFKGVFTTLGVSDKLAGRLVSVLTGSPITQGFWMGVGRLFGGGEKFKRTVGSATGTYIGGEFSDTGARADWFGGERQFGEGFDNALTGLNQAFSESLGGLFEMFDIDSDVMTSAAGRLRRTSGRLAAEFTAAFEGTAITVMGQYSKNGNIEGGMEAFFDDVMGRGLAQAIGASTLPAYLKELTDGLTKAQEVSDAIGGLFQRFDGTNAVLESLRLSAFKLTDAGLRGADSLLNLSAAISGLENPTAVDKLNALGSLTSAYYDNFFTEAEKQEDLIRAVTDQFKTLGLTAPQTKEAFRGIVEALDLTTDTGKNTFFSLMSISEQTAGYIDVLASRADNAAAALQNAAAALQQILMSGVNSSFGTVQRSISAERERLTAEYQKAQAAAQAAAQAQQQAAAARASSLNDMASTSRSVISALEGLDRSLDGALDRLLGTSSVVVAMRREESLAVLRDALSRGQAGKSLSGFDGLEEALGRASMVDKNLYASFSDFEREQGRTANLVADLQAINGKQLTAEEKLLAQLQAQASAAQASASSIGSGINGVSAQLQKDYEAAIAALDKELENAQLQIDAINGVDNSILSVGVAIDRMNAAVVAAINGQEGIVPGIGVNANAATIDRLYQSILGQGADTEGQKFWQNALANGVYSLSDLVAGLRAQAAANAAPKVPAFASGGAFTNGVVSRPTAFNMGIMGESGSEGILPLANIGGRLGVHARMGGSDNSELSAVRQELSEMKNLLVDIMFNGQKTANAVSSMDQDGVIIDSASRAGVAA